MRYRISRLKIGQSTLVVSLAYFVCMLAIHIVGTVVALVAGQGAEAFWLLLAPFVGTLFVAILLAVAFWIYNLVAGWVGGMELDLKEKN